MTKDIYAVSATDLGVTKNKKLILNDLTFTIPTGVITGLVGPSGSGKTTLMRAIVGVQKVSNGHVDVLGEPVGDKKLRSRIGYVTQSPSVYGDLTVEQNIRYFATIVRADKHETARVIEMVHLAPQRNQIVGTLSGGQRARVSLAVALLGDPDLLVLDEPTVGLDPVLREDLWALFQRLADSGKTLLVSSHVMDEAERCERLLLLRDGRLVWNDTRAALLTRTSANDVGSAFITIIKEGDN